MPGLEDAERIIAGLGAQRGDTAVTGLIPALSCRSCRPNPPFAELVRLSPTSIADGIRDELRRRTLGK